MVVKTIADAARTTAQVLERWSKREIDAAERDRELREINDRVCPDVQMNLFNTGGER